MQKGQHMLALSNWCGSGDLNPDGIATASPSSWCVCQFRHFRVAVRIGGLLPSISPAQVSVPLAQVSSVPVPPERASWWPAQVPACR